MPTIIEHNTPGNILYAGLGRKCPDCPCFFCSSVDFGGHRKICDAKDRKMGWRKNPDGSWWAAADGDPELKRALRLNGKITMNMLDYTLSSNEKWITRRTTASA